MKQAYGAILSSSPYSDPRVAATPRCSHRCNVSTACTHSQSDTACSVQRTRPPCSSRASGPAAPTRLRYYTHTCIRSCRLRVMGCRFEGVVTNGACTTVPHTWVLLHPKVTWSHASAHVRSLHYSRMGKCNMDFCMWKPHGTPITAWSGLSVMTACRWSAVTPAVRFHVSPISVGSAAG